MTTTATSTVTTGYRDLFRVGQFRVLWAGLVVFGVGFQMEVLALSVLAYARTGSALLGAVTFGIGFLPQIVGGLCLAALADRWPARRAVALGLSARAAPGLVIGAIPGMPLWSMLAVVAVAATFAPLVTGATFGRLADLLEDRPYVLARSVIGFTLSATQLIGLAIGGLALAAASPRGLLLIAGTALGGATAVAWVGIDAAAGGRTARAPAKGHASGAVAAIVDAVRSTLRGNLEILGRCRIRALLLAFWLPAWLTTGAESLIVPYVGERGSAAASAGAVLAAIPIGMLVSNVVVGRWASERRRAQLVLPLALLTGLPLMGFAVVPHLVSAVVLLGLAGLGTGYALGLQQPFVSAVPSDRRGQAFALNSTGLMGGQGLTPPLAGALATVVGSARAIAAIGIVAVIVVWFLRRTLRPDT